MDLVHSMEDNPFAPTHVIRLSELPQSEKEKYFDLLIEHDIMLHQDADGRRVADVRILAPGIRREKVRSTLSPSKARQTPRDRLKRLASTPTEDIVKTLAPVQIDGSEFDTTQYPRFSAFVLQSTITPKKRALTWTMKLIEEIYDARFTHDITDLQKEEDTEPLERDSSIFPIFVIDHISKRYGLQTLVDQTAWDLLLSVHELRKNHLEVEIFARFLQEVYDPDDLLFFMYLRSVTQKLVNESFRNRWSAGVSPKQLFLTYRDCVVLARTVFGNEEDSMFKDFLSMVEEQAVGQRKSRGGGGSDTRRIEVTQLFHLAIVGYHETRPEEDDHGHHPPLPSQGSAEGTLSTPGGGGGAMVAGVGGDVLLSEQEQDELFREAEAQYNARMKVLEDAEFNTSASVDENLKQEIQAQEMEDALRTASLNRNNGSAPDDDQVKLWAQDMLNRQGGGAPAGSLDSYLETIARDRDAMQEMAGGMGGMGLGNSGELVAGVLPDMGGMGGGGGGGMAAVQSAAEQRFTDALLEDAADLPADVVDEIRTEVASQLTEKVNQKLAHLGDLSTLRDEEMALVMDRLLGSPEITQEMEALVNLLTTYASNRLDSMIN